MELKEEIVELVKHPELRHESLKDTTVFVRMTVSDNCYRTPLEVYYEVSALYNDPTTKTGYRCRLTGDLETQEDVVRALREGFVAYNEKDETAEEVPA